MDGLRDTSSRGERGTDPPAPTCVTIGGWWYLCAPLSKRRWHGSPPLLEGRGDWNGVMVIRMMMVVVAKVLEPLNEWGRFSSRMAVPVSRKMRMRSAILFVRSFGSFLPSFVRFRRPEARTPWSQGNVWHAISYRVCLPGAQATSRSASDIVSATTTDVVCPPSPVGTVPAPAVTDGSVEGEVGRFKICRLSR